MPHPNAKESASPKALFLVGFMGAGKSSVGRLLGQRLNWPFEDLDDRIERREDRQIAAIFRESGEAEFRRAEREALQEVLNELTKGGPKIVALGGGAFAQERNAALLQSAPVTTLFLDAPVEELWQRCCKQAEETKVERPLLRSRGQFRELHRVRRTHYLKAGERMDTSGRSPEAIADDIVSHFALKPIAIRIEEGEAE